MSDKTTIFHNAGCGTSGSAPACLRAVGFADDVVNVEGGGHGIA